MKKYYLTLTDSEGVVVERLAIAVAKTEEELDANGAYSDHSDIDFAFTEKDTADLDPLNCSIEAAVVRALNQNFTTTPDNNPKPIKARIDKPKPAFKGE